MEIFLYLFLLPILVIWLITVLIRVLIGWVLIFISLFERRQDGERRAGS